MPTIEEVIARVDGLKLNAYSSEDKARRLIDIDGQIFREVMHSPEGVVCPMSFPEDQGVPLLVEAPYDAVYDYALYAFIDFHNRETENLNNSTVMFNKAMENFRKWYIRSHVPVTADGFINVI